MGDLDSSLLFNKGIDIYKLSTRRLFNLVEYMIKSNAKGDDEKVRVMDQLHRPPEEELNDPNQPPKRKKRSGKDKLIAYANKQRSQASDKVESKSQEQGASRKSVRRGKKPPPGFGMSLEEAQSMMNSMQAEDEELIRGKR